jgi:hypothetical protein
MSAPPAKPAIAADPGGPASQAAPRNGTSQPAPATAQQATQVGAAPTQVQAQRPVPANGGGPAPTQANGKPGGGGKEDEEDWWTE